MSVVSARVIHIRCPSGWTMADGGRTCIKVSNQIQMSWENARTECQKEGADLIQIRDSLTNNLVANQLTTGRRYWIGITDEDKNGEFEFVRGDDLSAFHPWARGEPNNLGGDERCVEIIGNKRGTWNDKRCSKRRHFICQKSSILNDENNPGNRTVFTLTTDFEKDDLPLHYTYTGHMWARERRDQLNPPLGKVLRTRWEVPGALSRFLYSRAVNMTEPCCMNFEYMASTGQSFIYVMHGNIILTVKLVAPEQLYRWQRARFLIPPLVNDAIKFQVGNHFSPGEIALDNLVCYVGTCV